MSSQDQVQAFLAAHDVQIAVLPEADVNVSSGLSFCNEWRARGHFAALSSPEAGLSKVALVSSIPFETGHALRGGGNYSSRGRPRGSGWP